MAWNLRVMKEAAQGPAIKDIGEGFTLDELNAAGSEDSGEEGFSPSDESETNDAALALLGELNAV